MNDHHRSTPYNSQQPSVVIGTTLPCDDLRQRLKRIYDIAINRSEKRKSFKATAEEEKTK